MKYLILEDDNKDDVERSVKNKLENGWLLAGGVHVVFLPNGKVRYFQAIYKEED